MTKRQPIELDVRVARALTGNPLDTKDTYKGFRRITDEHVSTGPDMWRLIIQDVSTGEFYATLHEHSNRNRNRYGHHNYPWPYQVAVKFLPVREKTKTITVTTYEYEGPA